MDILMTIFDEKHVISSQSELYYQMNIQSIDFSIKYIHLPENWPLSSPIGDEKTKLETFNTRQ